ncbi:uncharacterized protein EKO05_0008567 [Ascochyta rabiei]|uniref:Uncharacterized protein n=1 Tax=Didymella rabiei TaxID=5454 RepID=A0A163MLJ0_DIDRA|nr:uncharacterized protein EKO05_0008567 [Ascochyta rabiei]KZM28820.1 hypothetical protein ST47_g45 [Ascochyta rabiei]UPX18261.1 hypothetical protein EKO05_0008567 [Ascochyta rabiei]
MEPKPSKEIYRPDSEAPSKKLPEHVDGFIEVQTLIDIHKYLGESEKSDDISLAAWIRERYLYEPISEEARQIRDVEGFAKLDAAYRRVRLLTGKAQDKWPFFYRNWKKMSSIVVKNVVLGDAAMSTNVPVTKGGVGDSSTSNGFVGQRDSALYEPKLQVPFFTKKPTSHQVLSQKSSQPAPSVLASQPTPEQQVQHRAPEPSYTFTSDTTLETTVYDSNSDPSAFNGTVNSTVVPTTALRDARAGQVRGSYGRFVKSTLSPITARSGPIIKPVKKLRTKAALHAGKEEDAYSSSEDVKAPQAAHTVDSGITSDDDDEVIQSSSPNSNKDMETTNSSVNDSPASSVLAAEAEAVPSNLDRMPPGLIGRKRKSEPATQRGANKRVRGSRGGVLGRLRKSEPTAMDSPPSIVEDAKIRQVPSEGADISKMATRRSTRKSAVSTLKRPASPEPSARNGSQAVPQQKSDEPNSHPVTKDVVVALGSDGSATTKPNGAFSMNANGIDKPVRDTFAEDMPSDSLVQSAMSNSEAPDTRKASKSSKQKKRVSFVPETKANVAVDYEFFARIYTSGITEEISLSEEDLDHRGDIAKRYAAWQKSGEASITFETFKNIVKFAKQDWPRSINRP